MGDEYIWNMAAFLQVLPTLDATAYKELVDSSEGHSHGGGETQGHHDDEKAEDHPAPSEPGNNSMPHAHPPGVDDDHHGPTLSDRSEEHTSELQSLMRTSYAVFCLKKKKKRKYTNQRIYST